MPSQDSSFQRINTFVAFIDLISNLPESDAGQLWYFSVVEAGDEILDLAAPLRRDDTEFGKMSPYGVDQHGALAHQQIASPVQHEDGLLRFVLDRPEDHVRPHQRLDDCGSIIGVVLSAVLDVWLDLGGRDQPHLMAQCRDPSGPVVGGSARFHADDTGGQHFEKCFHAGTAKLSAQHRSPGLVDRMDLKNVFGEIKTYDSNRHLDGPPECGVTAATTLRHSMRVAAVVHTIPSLACRPSVCTCSPSPMTRFHLEISASTRARQLYPEARCQPMRPRSAIHRRCASRRVGAVSAAALGTAFARGGTTTAAAG